MANRERTKKKEGAAFPESGADSQAAISVSGADCTDTKAAISDSGADCTDTKAAISVAGAAGEFGGSETKAKSAVTRMSFRGRPAALLSPRGSSSRLFFLGPGRAPCGYSHTPNNTHNRRPSPPRAPLPRSARSGDRREDARRGRRPSKRKTRRGPPRRAMSVLK